MTLKDRVIKTAEAFYQCKTGDPQQRMIVALYNQIAPLPRGYRLKEHDAWCAAFVSVCAYVVGASGIVYPECGAHEMWNRYPDSRRCREHGKQAERGDLLFYDWNGDGRIDHVGIVLDRQEDLLRVIEGNFDNSCGIRFVTENEQCIYGSCRPDYGDTMDAVMFVDCDELNLRRAPSMDAEVLSIMHYGDLVEVLATTEGWARVEWSGAGGMESGYCGSGYLSESCPPTEGETTTAVYLRPAAGTGCKPIAVLPAGTRFYYTGDREIVGSSVWERIVLPEDPDKEGWINTRFARATL